MQRPDNLTGSRPGSLRSSFETPNNNSRPNSLRSSFDIEPPQHNPHTSLSQQSQNGQFLHTSLNDAYNQHTSLHLQSHNGQFFYTSSNDAQFGGRPDLQQQNAQPQRASFRDVIMYQGVPPPSLPAFNNQEIFSSYNAQMYGSHNSAQMYGTNEGQQGGNGSFNQNLDSGFSHEGLRRSYQDCASTHSEGRGFFPDMSNGGRNSFPETAALQLGGRRSYAQVPTSSGNHSLDAGGRESPHNTASIQGKDRRSSQDGCAVPSGSKSSRRGPVGMVLVHSSRDSNAGRIVHVHTYAAPFSLSLLLRLFARAHPRKLVSPLWACNLLCCLPDQFSSVLFHAVKVLPCDQLSFCMPVHSQRST